VKSIDELLSVAKTQGIQLWVRDGKLNYRFPRRGPAPPSLAEIGARKQEVVERLSRAADGRGALPPLVAAPRSGPLPLSFAQERLWMVEQFGGGSAAYKMISGLRARGPLDATVLGHALRALVARHESLRTRFESVLGTPQQVIDPPGRVPLEFTDLRHLGANAETRALEDIARQKQLPFDLANGPLLRMLVYRVADEEHFVVLMMHHIVSDGWSLGVLLGELTALYLAELEGTPAPLPALPVQYADFAVWQRGWLRDAVLDEQLSYWRERLRDAPAALELPTDRPRPAAASHEGAVARFEMPAELIARLREVARRNDATLYMVLLCAFKMLLAKYSSQNDIVIGSPIAGRGHKDLEGLIGCFVNMLPLRTVIAPGATFEQTLARVRDAALGAYAHQDIPFEKLVVELNPKRDLSRQPIFQVMFTLQNLPAERPAGLAPIQFSGLSVDTGGARFDLSMSLTETEAGLRGALEYATDLFDASTVQRFTDCFAQALRQIADGGKLTLETLSLLRPGERAALITHLNGSDTPFDAHGCIHDRFAHVAARAGDAIAIVDGARTLTYRELDQASNQWAQRLRACGVAAEVPVGVCMDRGADLCVLLLAILKAGGVYLPLEPSHPRERLDFLVRDARAPLVLTHAALLGKLTPCAGRVICVDEAWEADSAGTPPAAACAADNLAYLIYTSGSTGVPKGVGGTHRNAMHRICAHESIAPFATEDVACAKTSIAFVDSVFELLCPLSYGARVVLVPAEQAKDARRLREVWEHAAVTHVVTTPALASSMLRVAADGLNSLDSLRHWTLSGEALTPELVGALETRLPDCRLINLYGSTEVTADATMCVANGSTERVPIGWPMVNTRVYLLDEGLEPVAEGLPGEIYVCGAGLARGYLHRPDLTAERFIPNPFGTRGERLYRTGDRGRHRADGCFEYLGRTDHQVKLRGYRIELGECEEALRTHANVRDAVVALREVQGNELLVGYLVTRTAPFDAQEMRRFLQDRLPDYMVPSVFVPLEHFPLTATGKVDRSALPAPLEAPRTRAYLAPETPIEQALAAMWSAVLKVERVGLNDSFFELGGHSLLATQLSAIVQEQLSVELTLNDIFKTPVLADMAKQISLAAAAPGTSVTLSAGEELGVI
jgi:amino acid adenylation domain-containing protein